MRQLLQMRILFIVFGVFLAALACTPTKRTTTPGRPTPTRPGDTTTKPPSGKVDTVKWSTNDPKTHPPITDGKPSTGGGTKPTKPTGGNVRPGQNFTIGLLLPFQTSAFKTTQKVPEQSEMAFQFYAGAQIALAEGSERLKSNYKIEVADTDLTDDALRSELNKLNYENWDAVIGPMRSSQVQVLAGRTQTRKKVLISPQSVQPNLVKNYPEMVQISASLESHCRTLGEFALAKYSAAQIVLVCREKERERLEYFKSIHGWSAAVRTLVLPDNTASVTQSLKSYVSTTKTTAFILPSFGSQDFVNGFLTKLRADKGKNEVAVFGLPQWEEFSAIEYDLLEACNVHITRDYWWNTEGEDFLAFQKQFFEQFATVPSEHAVKGYDLMNWVTSGLEQEGLEFASSGARYDGLGYQLRLKSVIGADGTINYTENVRPRVLRFADLSLNPVDAE